MSEHTPRRPSDNDQIFAYLAGQVVRDWEKYSRHNDVALDTEIDRFVEHGHTVRLHLGGEYGGNDSYVENFRIGESEVPGFRALCHEMLRQEQEFDEQMSKKQLK